MREVPIEILHQKLSYKPDTGELAWKIDTQWTRSGHAAGTLCNGYIKISINKVIIPAHRIILAMENGVWPFGEVDHINGNRSDNRLSNLREVTHQQNCINRSKATNNKSGYVGVSWHAGGNKWQAHISVNRKTIYLGLFDTAEKAHESYRSAAKKIYGVFAKKHQYFPSGW
jgi:hypothetical protein